MPRLSVRDVEVDTSRLDRILRNLDANRDKAVRAIAFSIEAKAKPKTRIDTGALRASIYTRTHQGDQRGGRDESFSQIAGEVEAKRPGVGVSELPAPGPGEAVVGTGIEYGPAQEFGSTKQTGQPYLTPAVREVEQALSQLHGDDLRRIVTDEG